MLPAIEEDNSSESEGDVEVVREVQAPINADAIIEAPIQPVQHAS